MMKSDYEMELDYQVDLMRATAIRSRADELAEKLISQLFFTVVGE
ncbi:MAG TPA: hypothetical protein VFU37_09335 [Pyrinomonadaceae bacterium]|nr:hypothetical protein [Pyrinomonadaceae bacterium]